MPRFEKRRPPQHPTFIAVDGEGESYGRELTVKTPDDLKEDSYRQKRRATYRKHRYTLLASSNGTYASNSKGLSTTQCFDYLLSLPSNATLIAFAFDYDINMMIGDIDRQHLEELYSQKYTYWRGYSITWTPRHAFSVKRIGAPKGAYIWDIFGFFQTSFINALKTWGIGEPELIEHIESMKNKRSGFEVEDFGDILHYCFEECRLAVELMERLIERIDSLGLKLVRYDGAGALAHAMLSIHRPFTGNDNPLALKAYYGGRFENAGVGFVPTGYSYDIRSAYPAALVQAPCLKHQTWSECKTVYPQGVYHVKWTAKQNLWGPFPVRDDAGNITYPLSGSGWYWGTEILPAQPLARIRVLEGYRLSDKTCKCSQYGWINEYYAQRAILKQRGDYAHIAIKLGLNSLYGKTAQSIGWQSQKPRWQNYTLASWTTAFTRGKILSCLSQNPAAIVAIATDGLFSREKLDVPVSSDLGSWEESRIENLFLFQPGVYSYSSEGKETRKTRGFSWKELSFDDLKEAFRRQGWTASVVFSLTRFFGYGAAKQVAKPELWRCWVNLFKEIRALGPARSYRWEGGSANWITSYPPAMQPPSKPYSPKTSWLGEYGMADLDFVLDVTQD